MAEELYGIDQIKEAFRSGPSIPRLKIRLGERVHFYPLTNGHDKWMGGSRFHEFGKGADFRSIVCCTIITGEPCQLCDEMGKNRRRKFALWVWIWRILHISDNPDPEAGEAWPQVKWENRTLFEENLQKPLLLELGNGRDGQTLGQFEAAISGGAFQTQMWQLTKMGKSWDTTTYHLFPIPNSKPITKEIAALTKNLPSIKELYLQMLNYTPDIKPFSQRRSDKEEEAPWPPAEEKRTAKPLIPDEIQDGGFSPFGDDKLPFE